MNQAALQLPAAAATPRERLSYLRERIHGVLLDRASGKITASAVDQFAVTYRHTFEAARDTDAEYSGERARPKAPVIIRREGLVFEQVESPELAALSILRDVFRRMNQARVDEHAQRLAPLFLTQHPQIRLPAWTVSEWSTRQWIAANP